MDNDQERIAKIVGEIRSLHPRVDHTIKTLTTRVELEGELLSDSNRYASPDFWRLAAIRHGMVKIILIIEQNFEYIETFGLLATTRYMLELLIWFQLLTSDNSDYCFTFVKQVFADGLDYLKKHLAKVKREIELFQQLEQRELGETIEAAKRNLESPAAFGQLFRINAEEIDRVARRRFCSYNEDAVSRGYGLQAYLMEKQAIPELEQQIEQQEKKKEAAMSQMPKSVQGYKRWVWKDEAEKAGMSEQYDFVYSYTSRLLHAKAVSFATDQKIWNWMKSGGF